MVARSGAAGPPPGGQGREGGHDREGRPGREGKYDREGGYGREGGCESAGLRASVRSARPEAVTREGSLGYYWSDRSSQW
jgi:hypothetical protein